MEIEGPKIFHELAYALERARHPGIQLADFYAGAARDAVRRPDDKSLTAPLSLIEHQVVLHQVFPDTN